MCRIVTRTHRYSGITGPLMSLHWLPVKYSVQFKLGLITYKGYKNKYPTYFENYVQPYRSIYHTRRSEPARHMLSIPHYNYKQHKSFTHLSNSLFYSAPRLWNSLSETYRCASSFNIEFVLCSFEDISLDKVIPAIAFYHINISGRFLTNFLTTDYGYEMVDAFGQRNCCATTISDFDFDLCIWIFKSLFGITRN